MQVKIKNIEELKQLENTLDPRQPITFICPNCQKETERPLYRLQAKNYDLLCRKCSFNKANQNTWNKKSKEEIESIKEKRKQTFIKKYGVENPFLSEQIQGKIKNTNLEKYGETSFSKTQQFKDKTKQTWENKSEEELKRLKNEHEKTVMQKYGVKNILESKEIREKIKQTNLEKYGTEWQQQSEKGKQDRKNTMIKRYGVDNPSKSKEIQERKKQTNIQKYGTEFSIQSKIIKNKIKATMLERYGAEYYLASKEGKKKLEEILLKKYGVKNPNQIKKAKEKSKQTCLEKYGVPFYFQSKELQKIRRSSFLYDNISFDSKPELAFYIYCKDHNKNIIRNTKAFDFEENNQIHKYYPDFEIDGKFFEIKGDQFLKEDNTWNNPFDHTKDNLYEAKHQAALKNNVKILYSKDYQKYIDYVNQKYTTDFLDLFRTYLPFPYLNENFNDKSDLGILHHFHRSIYDASKLNCLSPKQAWENKNIIKKVALNRLKYVQSCTPGDIRQGFSVTRIAPKISIFKPWVAKDLINEYLNSFEVIVDPFSGFSGRLLGAINCEKKYIGKDINETHVKESNEIIEYKKAKDTCSVTVEDLLKKQNVEECDCLFTCPPYGGKEHWNLNNDEVEKSCDEWIDLCLKHYKCKKYLFVVDETEKYKDYIIKSFETKNGLFKKMNEKIVLI